MSCDYLVVSFHKSTVVSPLQPQHVIRQEAVDAGGTGVVLFVTCGRVFSLQPVCTGHNTWTAAFSKDMQCCLDKPSEMVRQQYGSDPF